MRGEHSQSERVREVRVTWRPRLAEEKSEGFSSPSLVVLFVALGGENSLVRRPCGAIRKRARQGRRESKTRGAGEWQELESSAVRGLR
eukprot:6206832-Pleurochrysis_carterae.AAC.1